MEIWPDPGTSRTLAIAVLRRPVLLITFFFSAIVALCTSELSLQGAA
jgi:hypothetical protein